jgi:endo-1,4-beta-xylanase
MAQTLKVKLTGMDGESMPEGALKSLYSANLRFDPVKRRSTILPDGTVEIEVPSESHALYARIRVPDFGELWMEANNSAEGYRAGAGLLDFVREAAVSRLAYVRLFTEGKDTAWSVDCQAHLAAASEYLEEAGESADARAARLRLLSLSHGLWAGELAVVEHARAEIMARPKREGYLFGNTVFGRFFGGEGSAGTQARFTELFNFGILPFYLRRLEPEEGKPDYGPIDEALAWCESHGITPKGHPLWWAIGVSIPPWLEGADWAAVQHHCRRVVHRSVERYRGRIKIWDAINEAHDWANVFGLSQEQEIEITRIACDSIREKDPDAIVTVNHCQVDGSYAADEAPNEESMRTGPISDRVMTPRSYVERLMEAGVDFDVVGLQMYFPSNMGRDMMTISRYLDEFARFGKPLHITELGLPSGKRDYPDKKLAGDELMRVRGEWHQPWCEKVHADWTEWLYTLAYSRSDVGAVVWWGLRDPSFIPAGGWLRKDGTPKEAYYRMRTLLGDWGQPR